MPAQNAILIFDIGKTNKKVFLFDEDYTVLHEDQTRLEEIKDEDDFPCEDVYALTAWMQAQHGVLKKLPQYHIGAANVSGYGASMVYLDSDKNVCAPLYNYLKPYPDAIKHALFEKYGGIEHLCSETASPYLGSLNSGLQLLRIKKEQPQVFNRIRYTLHLPQYAAFVLNGHVCSERTSIGCHTMLWDFEKDAYHQWVQDEKLVEKFPDIMPSHQTFSKAHAPETLYGIGLHDSSAALVPYLKSFSEPFILLSTGTWSISLNPFNHTPLTPEQLQQDCLSYMSPSGKTVQAARLFAGHEHEAQTARLSAHFIKPADYYKNIRYDASLPLASDAIATNSSAQMLKSSIFEERNLSAFESYESAYHQLMADMVLLQKQATGLVMGDATIKKLFVDGGFGNNEVYMHILAKAFSDMEVYAAEVAQASALGAALILHEQWNKKPLPENLVRLKRFNV